MSRDPDASRMFRYVCAMRRIIARLLERQDDAPIHLVTETGELPRALRELERARIESALEACAQNQTEAAKRLGISRGTLAARLVAFGIKRPRSRH